MRGLWWALCLACFACGPEPVAVVNRDPVKQAEQAKVAAAAAEAAQRALERQSGGGDDGVRKFSAEVILAKQDEAEAAAQAEADAEVGTHDAGDDVKVEKAQAATRPVIRKPQKPTPGVQVYRGDGTKTNPYVGARWLQGSARGRGTELVIFWELWCPHCKRYLPKYQATADRFSGSVKVVGLTSMNQGTREGDVRTFLRDEGIRYAIGVIPESTKTRLGVSAVPHAMVLKDGHLVWRGHPADIQDTQLAVWAKD